MNNPFPGPQPYRVSDQKRFHGRDELSQQLQGAILVNRCVVVHGPSGAGKSSLVQASVLPHLARSHDIRSVRVDRWPYGESPTVWLANAMYGDLGLGDVPPDLSPTEAVISAARRAARGSPRLVVVYVDQLEQLLYQGRDVAAAETFFDCLSSLIELPLRTLRVVLSLREDYLGRLRDRCRDRRRLLEATFRVGAMTVGELTAAVCRAAATGEPPQTWSPAEMRELMLQVRVPGQEGTDDAEAQSTYAQIVCRALFQQRATGGADPDATQAEPILRRYLETTLSALGPLRSMAQRVLEDHLVSNDGSRTLRTENELLRIVTAQDLQAILSALESSAILHAEQHQGSRYFEIGHDWLARWVFEQRQVREQDEAQRKRDAEQQAALAQARRSRRLYLAFAIGALAVAATTGTLGLLAYKKQIEAEAARKEALANEKKANIRQSEAHDASILAGFRELVGKGKHARAIKLLAEVDFPAERRGWISLASDALQQNALEYSFEGHTGSISVAEWSTDGKHILTGSADGTIRVWNVERRGDPEILKGPSSPVTFAAWSHDNRHIVATFVNGQTLTFEFPSGTSRVISPGQGELLRLAAWNRDDSRILTMSAGGMVQIHAADGHGIIAEFDTPDTTQTHAIFHPDGIRVFTGAEDGVVRVWDGKNKGRATNVGKHEGSIRFLATSPDGKMLVSTSSDRTAQLWTTEGNRAIAGPKMQHQGAVNHAAWSADGQFIATASTDRSVRIWPMNGNGSSVVLGGHTHSVRRVSFQSQGQFVATVSQDGMARVFSASGGPAFVLRGHDGPIGPIAWSPDGKTIVTAASDETGRSGDHSVKVWRAEPFRLVAHGAHMASVVHGAFLTSNGASFVLVSDDGQARFSKFGESLKFIAFSGHKEWMTYAAISPQMDRVATSSLDDTVRIYAVDGHAEPIVLKGPEKDLRFAVFSPDGTRVLTGSDNGHAQVFSINGQAAPVVLTGHNDALTAGAWSGDGKRVVTVSLDQQARVWNTDGSGLEKALPGHTGPILCVGFFPKDERIVTGSADHTARIWKPDGTYAVLPHDAAVTTMAIREDGAFLATASADRMVHIWRSDLTAAPIEFESPLPLLALAFRGQTEIVAILQDGTEHTWMLDVPTLMTKLWQANSECISVDMRRVYLGEPKEVAIERHATCLKSPTAAVIRPRALLDSDLLQWIPETGRIAPHVTPWTDATPIRGNVVVLPADADVEVAGVAVIRRQGLVELVGNAGNEFKLRVQKGDMFGEFTVRLSTTGPTPPQIVLEIKPKQPLRPKPNKRGVLLQDDM